MSPAGFRQTRPRFRPLHLSLVSHGKQPQCCSWGDVLFPQWQSSSNTLAVSKGHLNGISKLLEMERNVWISYSNLAGCSLPSKYQICRQLFLSAKDLGTFFTPHLQPRTSGFLSCLAEDYTMPVTAAHLVTKCFHLWQ